jgi:hypothetical protein
VAMAKSIPCVANDIPCCALSPTAAASAPREGLDHAPFRAFPVSIRS